MFLFIRGKSNFLGMACTRLCTTFLPLFISVPPSGLLQDTSRHCLREYPFMSLPGLLLCLSCFLRNFYFCRFKTHALFLWQTCPVLLGIAPSLGASVSSFTTLLHSLQKWMAGVRLHKCRSCYPLCTWWEGTMLYSSSNNTHRTAVCPGKGAQ